MLMAKDNVAGRLWISIVFCHAFASVGFFIIVRVFGFGVPQAMGGSILFWFFLEDGPFFVEAIDIGVIFYGVSVNLGSPCVSVCFATVIFVRRLTIIVPFNSSDLRVACANVNVCICFVRVVAPVGAWFPAAYTWNAYVSFQYAYA